MAECYPQGCPPCDGEIVFPESPINGQRYCINIGLDPNTQENMQKCWVYDHCIPGWRAEGPTVSPITFKGGVDLTLDLAGNNINSPEAGDYYIVEVGSAAVGALTAQQWLDSHWVALQHEVPRGSFIMWSGTEWVEVPRPCGDEQRVDDLEAQVDALEVLVAGLDARLVIAEGEVLTLKGQVSTLETQAIDFETRIAALENP